MSRIHDNGPQRVKHLTSVHFKENYTSKEYNNMQGCKYNYFLLINYQSVKLNK